MSITGFDHIYLESQHYEKSKLFWKSLGFTIQNEWGEGDHKACQLKRDDAIVVLAKATDNAVRPTVHFKIKDPVAFQKTLSSDENVVITTPLEDTHWGTKWIRIRDPDGNEYALEADG